MAGSRAHGLNSDRQLARLLQTDGLAKTLRAAYRLYAYLK